MSNVLSILGWVAAALLTFLAVSLAFLFLASFGSSGEDVRIEPESNVATTGSQLEMSLDEDEIETLAERPDQTFTITLTNGGDRSLRDINVLTEVSSEDTSLPDTAPYRRAVPEIPPGESRDVTLEVDLSETSDTEDYPAPETPRKIVEIRATTPEGISAVTTIILRVAE